MLVPGADLSLGALREIPRERLGYPAIAPVEYHKCLLFEHIGTDCRALPIFMRKAIVLFVLCFLYFVVLLTNILCSE